MHHTKREKWQYEGKIVLKASRCRAKSDFTSTKLFQWAISLESKIRFFFPTRNGFNLMGKKVSQSFQKWHILAVFSIVFLTS